MADISEAPLPRIVSQGDVSQADQLWDPDAWQESELPTYEPVTRREFLFLAAGIVAGTAATGAGFATYNWLEDRNKEKPNPERLAEVLGHGFGELWNDVGLLPGMAVIPAGTRLYSDPTLQTETTVDGFNDSATLVIMRPFDVKMTLDKQYETLADYDKAVMQNTPVPQGTVCFWNIMPGNQEVENPPLIFASLETMQLVSRQDPGYASTNRPMPTTDIRLSDRTVVNGQPFPYLYEEYMELDSTVAVDSEEYPNYVMTPLLRPCGVARLMGNEWADEVIARFTEVGTQTRYEPINVPGN